MKANSSDWVESLLAPLDKARARTLKTCGASLRPLIVKRDLRVAVGGVLLLTLALVGTGLVPFWLLALGPILLGVPHLVSDLRYLVVRTGALQRRELWLAAGIPLLLAGLGGGLLAGLLACAGVLLVAEGPSWRRWAGLLAVGVLWFVVLVTGRSADLFFAHAHNAIAVLLWWLWRRRESALAWIPLLGFVGCCALILCGGLDALTLGLGAHGSAPGGMNLRFHASSLAPGLTSPLAFRIVLLFAFAQSVHYSIWLRWLPEEDRPHSTPRSFRSSYRALKQDLGVWFLWFALVTALLVACWAFLDLTAARTGYLRMALFHGHLELAALTFLWMEGRPALSSKATIPVQEELPRA